MTGRMQSACRVHLCLGHRCTQSRAKRAGSENPFPCRALTGLWDGKSLSVLYWAPVSDLQRMLLLALCARRSEDEGFIRTCRPLHHNAHAVENILYMVDEVELAKLGSAPPPCDGESDLGRLLQMPLTNHPHPLVLRLCACILALGLCHAVWLRACCLCMCRYGRSATLILCRLLCVAMTGS